MWSRINRNTENKSVFLGDKQEGCSGDVVVLVNGYCSAEYTVAGAIPIVREYDRTKPGAGPELMLGTEQHPVHAGTCRDRATLDAADT